MFDFERFVEECKAAAGGENARETINELVTRAVEKLLHHGQLSCMPGPFACPEMDDTDLAVEYGAGDILAVEILHCE